MRNKIIYGFIKFFNNELFADQFIKGRLHLERLSYFRKIEADTDKPDKTRGDRLEGLLVLKKSEIDIMRIRAPGFDEILKKKKIWLMICICPLII